MSKSSEKFTASCSDQMKKSGKQEMLTVIAYSKQKAIGQNDAEAAMNRLQNEQMATRRAQLLEKISHRYGKGQEFCKNYQESRMKSQARIVSAAPKATQLWLADAVAISGTKAEIEDLANHEDIRRIDINPVFKLPKVQETPLEDTPEMKDGSAWGIAKILAPEVWGGLGRGDGIVVGHLDTGVDDTHPALAGKVSFFEEFDFLGNPLGTPVHDSGSHGTHTAGTICGRTFRGSNIGVAPGVQLASALVIPGGSGTFAQIVAGMQWTLLQNATIINMSLGGFGYSTLWNQPILNATLSGALVVASIGNDGNGTSRGPGNDLFSLGVGATHHTDSVAGFSGGQVMMQVPYSFGGIELSFTYSKPDISAPGVQVISCVPGNQLAAFNGTSMAAPHVAGAAALVMSASAHLNGNPFAVREILLGTIEDFGEAGKDNRYGFGRLDAQSAVEMAVSSAP